MQHAQWQTVEAVDTSSGQLTTAGTKGPGCGGSSKQQPAYQQPPSLAHLRFAKAARTWPGRPHEEPGMMHTWAGEGSTGYTKQVGAGHAVHERWPGRRATNGWGLNSGCPAAACTLRFMTSYLGASYAIQQIIMAAQCEVCRTLCFMTSHCTTALSSSQPAQNTRATCSYEEAAYSCTGLNQFDRHALHNSKQAACNPKQAPIRCSPSGSLANK